MKFPEQFRRSFPGYESGEGNPFGAFQIPGRHACGRMLNIIACDGVETGWEHVSVSIMGSDKCPSWTEMCCVKELFWDDEETVIQLHPPQAGLDIEPSGMSAFMAVRGCRATASG